MKCPKCNQERCKYNEQRKKNNNRHIHRTQRTNFNAKCKCGWNGII